MNKLAFDFKPIPRAEYTQMKAEIAVSTYYGPCDNVSAVAASMRNAIIRDKIIKNYNRMNRLAPAAAKYYKARPDILKLSRRLDFPPLNLLKSIFLARGDNPTVVYNAFKTLVPAAIWSEIDIEQFRIAEANDADSVINQQKAAEIAAANELAFVNYVSKFARIKTQEDLVAEQIAEFGRPITTPDVLFDTPVEVLVNGVSHTIAWIDFKNYVGTAAGFLLKSNSAQAAKYTAKYGPGAMCYRYGFVCGLSIFGAILLSAENLPIEWYQ